MTTTAPSTRPAARTGPPVPAAAFAPRATERVLTISPLPGRREAVVTLAVRALQKRYGREVVAAETTIREHGLTIEATRLRDRLERSLRSDLDRLLMSTPGVPELLFNKAIEAELKEEEEFKEGVKDESVQTIGERLEAVVTTLEKVASHLDPGPKPSVEEESADLTEGTHAERDAAGNAERSRRNTRRSTGAKVPSVDDKTETTS